MLLCVVMCCCNVIDAWCGVVRGGAACAAWCCGVLRGAAWNCVLLRVAAAVARAMLYF